MGKHDELIRRILSARSDANISFTGLQTLLLALGFDERTRSSHHIFSRADIEELLNLQRHGNKAKPYQVRQVRALLLRYRLVKDT
jgi:hypothetical protein